MSLTERIQALTTYANEVTGKSDTTLSDAVASLADGYGGEGSPALFPFPWSKFSGTTTTKEVTNGNHVKVHSTSTAQTFILNLPNALSVAVNKKSFGVGDLYYPPIPSGTEVTVAIKNVETNLEGYGVATTAPNGNTDMNSSPLGEDGHGIAGTNNRKSFTFTTTQETQISSFYLVFDGTGNADIEFDFELTVGGVRWI